MRSIHVEKLILNCSVGEPGDRLTKASRVLNQLTEQDPVETTATRTIRSFGIRRGEKNATHVTVRGERALDLIERGLKVRDYEINESNFSTSGTFGFGVAEHIDLGLKYDPSTGIYGLDFFVVLGRPGYRVSRKKHAPGRVGIGHRVTRADAIQWIKDTFNADVRK